MQLWLIRHTHAPPAGADENDAARKLSPQGRATAEELGRFFRRHGALSSAALCWHGPLVRARETAELLRAGGKFDGVLQETGGIAPEDDPVEIAERLEKWTGGSLVLVGHEPHLGALGTLLVRGKVKPVQFELKKGAVLALESTGGVHTKAGRRRWQVRWLLAPALLRTEPPKK